VGLSRITEESEMAIHLDTTFFEIKTRADKVDNQDLRYRIESLILSAEQNAEDTISIEKADTPERFEKIAADSLGLLLCYSTDKPVVAWFKRHGFKF
jgi:hypothetical protein